MNIIKERRARKEEKQREEELRAKMSAKKLQRMKKVSSPHALHCYPADGNVQREGRSKKING